MAEIFVVDHWYEKDDGAEVVRTIGLYSSAEKAHAAVERAKKLPGFRELPDNFSVDKYTVGRDHWIGGFESVGG
ncbi:DUF7336 domain-containing protein [Nocardia asteroides]|uniref:DUF7336 domain-containing protein n=1 Tax=Nocardia asteroides TaxID=1824 RepID=UPI001E4459F5|nr:hypothetical protein [Nocardia asteroides]UGT53130.1 hypothetical protein LTT85_20820 [Nocardia asteroides]